MICIHSRSNDLHTFQQQASLLFRFDAAEEDVHCAADSMNSAHIRRALSSELGDISSDLGAYISLLLSCGRTKSLSNGMLAHHLILKAGIQHHTSIGSQLLQMYGKCGALLECFSVFSDLPHRNVFAFNYILGEQVSDDRFDQAVQLFHQMLQEAIMPNRVTFVSLLSASSASCMHVGIQIHARVIRSEFQADVVVGTALVSMYGRHSQVENAQRMFDSLLERNVVSWTAILALYANQGQHNTVFYLCQQMETEGTLADKVTYVNVLGSVSSQRMVEHGKRLHALIYLGGLESDLMVGNAIISMYSQCGCLEDAQNLFSRMPRRDIISWTAFIVMFLEHGNGAAALQLLGKMQLEGISPDLVCFMATLSACGKSGALTEGNLIHGYLLNTDYVLDLNVSAALINMYGKCGSPDDARRVFDMVPRKDVFMWNTMISVYGQDEQLKEALLLFEIMQRENKVQADEVTFVSMLDACAARESLADGKIVHAFILSNSFEINVIVCNAVINLYGKCGSLEDAQITFDGMVTRNAISWTTIIAVYAQHGQVKASLAFFLRMQKEGPKPDDVTFLSLLVACKHSGLVSEGCQFFFYMTQIYHLSPGVDHFSCMIDLLGRTGRVDAAKELFDKIPLQPTAEAFTALLASSYLSHVGMEDSILTQSMEINTE